MPTLNWIGKDAVVNHHNQVPFRLLKCNEKLSVTPPSPLGEGPGGGVWSQCKRSFAELPLSLSKGSG